MAEEETSLRDSLDAAFEKVESAETPDTPETPDTTSAAPEPQIETPEEVAKEPKEKAETVPPKKAKAKEAPSDDGEEKPTQLPKSKAPGSWKPAAREKWVGLPSEVQAEVMRRERDIATGFNEIAAVKKFRDEFADIIGRNQNIVQAEGGDAMKLTRDLYTTAAALYHGSAQQKVMTVAGMIKNFGVDLRMLDTVLAGQQVPGQQQGNPQMDIAAIIRQQVQRELAPIFGQQTQALESEVSSEIETFANDPTNEFFDDVKDTMADLMEVSAKQGRKMDLSTAYKRATLMHSEIADVITERNLRSKASQQNSAASKARKRAVSLRAGAPSTELASGEFNEKRSLGDDIRASIDALSG